MPRAISSSAPVGSCIDLPTTTAPAGYLYCDGTAVSRTIYAGLFSVIGVAHGSGDGSTTFNIPDRRGYFPRGVDNGAGRDPDVSSRTAMNAGGNTGDNVGSIQTSQYASHLHGSGGLATSGPSSVSHTHGQGNLRTDLTSGGSSAANNSNGGNATPTSNVMDSGLGSHTHPISGNVASSGGNETRGINAYTNVFIRY